MKIPKRLLVWQKGFRIAVECFRLTGTFPKEERFSLSNQITRPAVSIPSNSAEGGTRSSEKDRHRFLGISLGSAFELKTRLLIADAVNCGDKELRQRMLQDVSDEQKMLTSFTAKLAR